MNDAIRMHTCDPITPNIGSYVGGDITAGALVSMIWNQPEFLACLLTLEPMVRLYLVTLIL